MYVKFEGLDGLISEFSKLASESEQEKANVGIVKKCAKVVEKNLKPKVHRSKDVSKSGLKGLKTGKHAADNIEIGRVTGIKGVKYIEVGWDQNKNKPYSYMQWEEWGNTTRKAHKSLYPTIYDSRAEMNMVAAKEYEKLISKLK